MTWQGIEGHDSVVEQFRRALERGRLGSTFLFVGPAGIGKRKFAEKLAQSLLCLQVPEEQLAPCGVCDSCVQVGAGAHPDLYVVEKPADKSSLPVSLFIGDDAHRMREGLCHDIALKPMLGGRKVVIVDDADFLNEEGANCLLKTLEEPPPRSVLILIGTSADKQLPTIRSRAQIIRFRDLPQEALERVLLAEGLAPDAQQASRLAELADGSVSRAGELADDDLQAFRDRLLGALARPRLESVELARDVMAFVEAAGKEASARRARARQVVGFAIDFYRQVLRAASGAPKSGDARLAAAAASAVSAQALNVDTATAALERSLEALDHIDRNAHQAALVECWADDLARVYQGTATVA